MSSRTELGLPSEDSLASADDGSVSSDVFRNAVNNNAGDSNTATAIETTAIVAAATSFTTNSRNSSRTSFELALTDAFRDVTVTTLHEYFWPRNSLTDRYFVQEQLAVFLDTKSFKRKYPDLCRRSITDADEKGYLLENGVVTETQFNMGLAALRAEDVYDLMTNDYADKFEEYRKVIAERSKKALAVKQMELQAVKADSKRLEEWRKKAMSSATEWNADLNRDRVKERRYYLDMETMVIQAPRRQSSHATPTNFGAYPTALVSGQYQEFHKKYSSDELYRLPVNGVMHIEDYLPVKRSHSPEAITVRSEELLQAESEESNKRKAPKRLSSVSSTERLSAEDTNAEDTGEICAFCQEAILSSDRYVQCSKCGSCGHPLCMDMTNEMYNVVRNYNWMCMECKPCSICSKLDEEDKMLFCDRCDRGYHTFCVGLRDLPIGRWVCTRFCYRYKNMGQRSSRANLSIDSDEPDKAAEAAVAAVVATSSTMKPRKGTSLDQTVEAVAQAVLAAAEAAEHGAAYSPASIGASCSQSNSPQPSMAMTTIQRAAAARAKRRHSASVSRSAPCMRCGAITARGRRTTVLCTKCLLVSLKMEQRQQQQNIEDSSDVDQDFAV